MENPVSKKILDRIKNLLQLSNSSNVNEASVAAAKAQELIDKYKLDIAEINATNNISSKEDIEEDQTSLVSGQRMISWHWTLISCLCEANCCRAWYDSTYNQLNKIYLRELKLIGTRTNIEITRYMFSYLLTEIERLTQNEMKFGMGKGHGKTWGNSFRLGAVAAISDKLNQTKKSVEKAYVGSQALVLIKQDEEALDKYHEDFRARKKFGKGTAHRIWINDNAKNAGYKAGSNIHLGKGLVQNTSSKLLNK